MHEYAETATLEEAFAIVLREDFRVTTAYTNPSIVTVTDIGLGTYRGQRD